MESRFEKAGVVSLFLDEETELSVDNMPDYAANTFYKQLSEHVPILEMRNISSDGISTKLFGHMLGAKVSVLETWAIAVKQWNQLGPPKRAECDPEIADVYRKLGKVVAIAESALPKLVSRAVRAVA